MAELPGSDVAGRPESHAAGSLTQDPPPRTHHRAPSSTVVEDGFSGWGWFAGGLLGLVGLFQILIGIVALAGTGYYTVPARNLVLDAGYTTWGWVHLILGVVALVTGGGLVFGKMAARVVGVVLAGVSAVVNLGFLPAAPVAASLIIALDVFVIYAITVHGGEPQRAH
jgi:hypothetical protein